MRLIACLALPLLFAAAQPALAAPPSPASPARAARDAAQTTPASPGRIDNAQLRAAIEALKDQAKRANRRASPAEGEDCTDCPEAARRHVHPTASEAPRVDCIHCIDRPAYA